MKKLSLLFAGTLFMFLSLNVQAQTPADYFVGKWNVVVKGTPDKDSNMVLVLERNADTLSGVVQDTDGNEISKIDSTELSDDSATFYFNAGGYDVTLELSKADEDHVTGNLMGMFEAEGERVTETK